MRAYKCDRCGEFFEKDKEIYINRIYYKMERYDKATGGRSINLCESCRQSFVNWFTECKYKEEKAND